MNKRFILTLWSEWHGEDIETHEVDCSRLDAENTLADMWNGSAAVTAERGRYRAELRERGQRRALSIIS
ncbi:MAG: hypothetical protein EBS21_09020 [Sphingomonadaceae bacterium]|nr:hypothetical protein [Sphingomonadaceae bacterium]